jgi:flagella basal body P-ring formation protein FlgA
MTKGSAPVIATMLVACASVGAARVDGAPRAAGGLVSPVGLCSSARAALQRAVAEQVPGAQLQSHCEEPLPSVAIPEGEVMFRAADLVMPRHGRQVVVVDVLVGDRVVRKVRVPLSVALSVPQWCAVEPVPAGAALGRERFTACLQPLMRADQLVVSGSQLPEGRVTRALTAGEALRAGDVTDPEHAARGDAVQVVYRAGSLMLQSRGELRRAGRIGDLVQVRLADGQTVSGRLVGATEVQLQETP